MRKTKWTKVEDRTLREMHAAGRFPKHIAKALERSLNSVYAKLNELGLGYRETRDTGITPRPSVAMRDEVLPLPTHSIVDQARLILFAQGLPERHITQMPLDERMRRANQALYRAGQPQLGRKDEWLVK